MSAGSLVFADAVEVGDAAAYLQRLLRLDRALPVRLRCEGTRLGLFAATPLGVIALRVVELADALTLDATVSGSGLLARVEDLVADPESRRRPLLLQLPERRDTAWASTLPPSSGWRWLGAVSQNQARTAVEWGRAAFREQVEAQGTDAPARASADAIAERLWSREVISLHDDGGEVGLPLRLLHAAHTLGFLGDADAHDVRASGPWVWLDAEFGSVYWRPSAATGLTPQPR